MMPSFFSLTFSSQHVPLRDSEEFVLCCVPSYAVMLLYCGLKMELYISSDRTGDRQGVACRFPCKEIAIGVQCLFGNICAQSFPSATTFIMMQACPAAHEGAKAAAFRPFRPLSAPAAPVPPQRGSMNGWIPAVPGPSDSAASGAITACRLSQLRGIQPLPASGNSGAVRV